MHPRWLLGGHGITVYPSGTRCGPRHIPDWEFLWIVSGSCCYDIHAVTHQLLAGDVVLVPPGCPHCLTWDTAGYTRHGYVHFTISDLDQDLPEPATWPLWRRPPANDLLRPLLDHALVAIADANLDFAVRCLRLALRAYVSGAGCDERTRPAAPPLIEAAFAWIADRWAEGGLRQLPLTDLARAVEVSPGHLDRAFRKHLGISPMEAQRRLRLDRAAHLVRDGGQSVLTAATATGFASAFHCSRRFSACYGFAPSSLRGGNASGVPLPPLDPPALVWLAERVWRRAGASTPPPSPPRPSGGSARRRQRSPDGGR